MATYGVCHADLGIVWDDGLGELKVAFGDTSASFSPTGGPAGATYTTGTLGTITGTNPYSGIALSSMLANSSNAIEGLIAGCPSFPPQGPRCIPTGAATIDGVDFVHFMMVENFDPPCTNAGYQTHGSGIAWRTAGTNEPFQIAPVTGIATIDWGARSNFGQVALLADGDTMYMFGTPPGRAGAVQLARASGSRGVYYGVWQFWDGTTWQSNQANAAYIVPALEADASTARGGGRAAGSVSELSVQFDPGLGRYLMTYLDLSRTTSCSTSGPTGAIVFRDAPNVTGPWTEEKQMLSANTVPGLYGGFMYPQTVSGSPYGSPNGTDLFFNVSEWGTYNVYPYYTSLFARPGNGNLITDGSFEEQLGGPGASCCLDSFVRAVYPPWVSGGDPAVGIDSCLGNESPGAGKNNAWINAADAVSAWHDLHQSVAVAPNTRYELTVHLNTNNVGAGYVGIRSRGAPIAANGVDMCAGVKEASDPDTPLAETSFGGTSNGYSTISFPVNSLAHSLVDVYVGFWSKGGGADSWVQVDDVSLAPLEQVNDGSFELQSSGAIGWPYATEGTGAKGIDRGAGYSRTGQNNAWINTTNLHEWNAVTQVVGVTPGRPYLLQGWVQTSTPFGAGYLGVRDANGTILHETPAFGPAPSYTWLGVHFTPTTPTVTLYAGYWTPTSGGGTWMRIDDLSIE
jgi:hypothetical protein